MLTRASQAGSNARNSGCGDLSTAYQMGGVTLADQVGVTNLTYSWEDDDPVTAQRYSFGQRAVLVTLGIVQLYLTFRFIQVGIRGRLGGCFVAGTPVLVPDELETEPLIVSAASDGRAGSAGRDWLLAVGAIMVGIAGFRDEAERAMRSRKRRKGGLDFFLQLGENKDVDPDCDTLGDGLREFVAWRAKAPATPVPSATLAGTVAMPSAPETMNDYYPAADSDVPVGCALAHRTSARGATRTAKTDNPMPVARRGRWWLAACLLVACFFAGKALLRPSAPPASAPKVSTASAVVAKRPASQPIETIRVGQRVIAQTPGASGETQVDPRTWRLLRLRSQHRWPDGTDDPLELDVLQPPDWIERNGAHVGAQVAMPLPQDEMLQRGELLGTVVADEPCPPIQAGQGRVVLATTTQLNAHVLELTLADEQGRQEPVRSTANHPFYSADRAEWVAAEDLREGEHLQGIEGRLRLLRSERLPGVHRVYNLTVEGEHVYRVSHLGALVHNKPAGGGTCPVGGPCFPAGTLVLMADGTRKPIETVRQGDLVLSADPEHRQAAGPRRVLVTTKNWTRRLIHIELDGIDGLAGEREVVATGKHPIWTQNRRWQYAEDVKAGDVLQDNHGHGIAVVRTWQEKKLSDTHNFTVDALHTYFVVIGGTPILVHNGGPPPLLPAPPPPPPALPPMSGANPWVGSITSTVTSSPMTAYRVWGGTTPQAGQWLTPTLPASSAEAQAMLALQPGNNAELYSEVLIPAGTRIQIGTAGPAFGQPGGGTQIQLLERIPSANFGPGNKMPIPCP
jgi:hypothetical protein